MSEVRLGDVVDDFCVKCRRLTNHSVVSLMNDAPAKVRCRTCYSEHDFRNGQPPPSRREAKKSELFREVLSKIDPDAGPPADSGEANPPGDKS